MASSLDRPPPEDCREESRRASPQDSGLTPTASTVPGGGAAPPVRPGGGTNQPGGQPNTFGGQPSPFGQPGGLGVQPGGFGGQPRGGQPSGPFQTAPIGR